MEIFLLSFIPLFVAIDVFGVLPLFIGFTENISLQARRKLITEATVTAVGISILFLFAGQMLFRFLGITESDFRIAGGILLVVLAIRDIMSAKSLETRRDPGVNAEPENVGVVPIGIPLIMGPAALTTILISAEAQGTLVTLGALIANLFIVWVVFQKSDLIQRFIGRAGSRAIAKVMALFLAAIGIMMIRVGVRTFL
jgi:multiple antibiotic resistance protein